MRKQIGPAKLASLAGSIGPSPDHMNSPLDNSELNESIKSIQNEAHQCHHISIPEHTGFAFGNFQWEQTLVNTSDTFNQVLTFENFIGLYMLCLWLIKTAKTRQTSFFASKTFSRHFVFSCCRKRANILLVGSQSDYRIRNIRWQSMY